MNKEAPLPQTTLVVLLGASQWPYSPDFHGSKAFANAMEGFKAFLFDPHRFGLPRENALDLFDADDGPHVIDRRIRQFLEQRTREMKQIGRDARDLLVYFVGHGGFVGRNSDYYLAVRCTSSENPGLSGIPTEALASTITDKARYLRRIIILDCCYAAAAFTMFQAEGPAKLSINQIYDAFEKKVKKVGRGTTMLCSSGKTVASQIALDESCTLFSKALLRAFSKGDVYQQSKPYLSLREVAHLTEEVIDTDLHEMAPRPELHSPDQTHGDVADIPFFPNIAFTPIKQKIKQKKYDLLTLLQRYLAILEDLHMSDQIQRMQDLRKDILIYNRRILVIGEFRRGKRTLINALLGQKVLPSSPFPWNAITSIIRWGETPKAVFYFRQPLEDNLTVQAIEVPIADIEKYMIFEDGYFSRYERLELFLPLNFCRDGIEIIHSPGLNEDSKPFAFLPTADVVMFLTACDFPLDRSEIEAINRVRESGHKTIFFMCNRFNMIHPEERELVRQRSQHMLIPFTERGTRSIFFVDALSGVNAHLTGDQEKLDQSGIPLVEKELKSFLATQAAQKFTQFADALKYSLVEVQYALGIKSKDFLTTNHELTNIKTELETFIQVNSIGVDEL